MLELTDEDLEDTFQCDTLLYPQAAVCWANPMAPAKTHYWTAPSWNDTRNDLCPCFPHRSETEMRQQHCKLFFTSWQSLGDFCYTNVLQGVSSHSPVSEVPPMWIPVPWHRFLYLSGAAAARAPSAWLISFILVASKEARGVGKGASIAALLVKKHRSLSCAVWQPGTRMCE